jgi:hypothetical protein
MKVRWMFVSLLCMALLPTIATALPRSADSATVPQDARDHDWEHDPRFEGHGTGYRQGFRDGFTDGKNDRDAGRRWHYGPGYKHPDRGYRNEFGDKDVYKREYRESYEKGYAEGFGQRR